MKTFNVFLRDNPTNMDVFLKDDPVNMDVFLKDRLVSMNVIIQTLMRREILTYDTKLLIDCIANELSLIKWTGAVTSMEIKAELDRLIEQAAILVKSFAVIDVDADVKIHKVMAGNSDMFLSTAEAETLLKVYNDFNSFQTISAELDSYSARLFLGNTNVRTYIGTSSISTNKMTYLKADNNIVLFGDTSFSGKKAISSNRQNMLLSLEQVGLFNLALASCNTLMNISATETMGLGFRSPLHGSEFNVTLHTEMLDSAVLKKGASVNNKVHLLSSVVWMLNKVIYPRLTDMKLSCEASAGIYRYRSLSEMDKNSLSDYDDMSLFDVGYISLE